MEFKKRAVNPESFVSALENFRSPKQIRWDIAERMKALRLSRNISQTDLATHSGVSLASLRRFEQTGEISLKHLVDLAVSLNCAGDFAALFHMPPPIDLSIQEKPARKRARNHQK